MLPSHRVEFISNINGSKVSINVYSHYTCLYGEYSGEGKTYLLDYIREGRNTGEIEVVVPKGYGFAIADEGSIDLALSNPNPFVIMIDEASALQENVIKKLNKSKHIIICVARSMPLKMDYPMQGMYRVSFSEESFDIQLMEGLPVAVDGGRYDEIVVESSKGRSEHQLLSVYLPNVVASGGRDNIQKHIRDASKRYLVFADLANIGRSYQLLMKRSRQGNVKFYNYSCFEELLYESNLVKSIGVVVDADIFGFTTIEKYYEYLLEKKTKGTNIEYVHGKPLKEGYVNKKNFLKVFSSRVSKGIRKYIEKYGRL